MASAMRKMAVYLGLVEDDHRYQDKYDSYGEYEDYEEQADRPEQIDEPDVRGAREDYPQILHESTLSLSMSAGPSAGPT